MCTAEALKTGVDFSYKTERSQNIIQGEITAIRYVYYIMCCDVIYVSIFPCLNLKLKNKRKIIC